MMDDMELVTAKEVESEPENYIWTSINSAIFLKNTWPKLKSVSTPVYYELHQKLLVGIGHGCPQD